MRQLSSHTVTMIHSSLLREAPTTQRTDAQGHPRAVQDGIRRRRSPRSAIRTTGVTALIGTRYAITQHDDQATL